MSIPSNDWLEGKNRRFSQAGIPHRGRPGSRGLGRGGAATWPRGYKAHLQIHVIGGVRAREQFRVRPVNSRGTAILSRRAARMSISNLVPSPLIRVADGSFRVRICLETM